MNFIERIIYCYEYVFYKEYTCFNCGIDFRMPKMSEGEEEDTSPACSYSCLVAGLRRSQQIEKFKNKFGKIGKLNLPSI